MKGVHHHTQLMFLFCSPGGDGDCACQASKCARQVAHSYPQFICEVWYCLCFLKYISFIKMLEMYVCVCVCTNVYIHTQAHTMYVCMYVYAWLNYSSSWACVARGLGSGWRFPSDSKFMGVSYDWLEVVVSGLGGVVTCLVGWWTLVTEPRMHLSSDFAFCYWFSERASQRMPF